MVIRSKAPLRLGLAGGGTDVSPYSDEFGGCVLNSTIDMYAYCTIELTDNDKVSFNALDRNEFFESQRKEFFEIDDLLALHKGVYNRINKEFGIDEKLSFSVNTYSDAPAGSGLGSSSTMVVAILVAYAELLNLPLGEYDIAKMAYEIERAEIGLKGGKQDQYAATFGGFNFIEFYKEDRVIVNPLRIKKWIVSELEDSMILFYTGTSRESAKIIEEQTKNTINKVVESVDAMHELKKDAYFMKESILKGDIKKFAEYLGKSWVEKKKMAKNISNPQIDKVYDIAINAGAYSGKVSGAGGGGFMMFLADPIKKINVIRELKKLDGQVLNFHFVDQGAFSWKIT